MKTEEFAKGSRRASITHNTNGTFTAWVGFTDKGEGTIPARHFKGYSTCSNDYKTHKAALKAVQAFLNA